MNEIIISLRNVSVRHKIYSADSYSFKKYLFSKIRKKADRLSPPSSIISLDSVDLTVNAGDRLAVIGDNGSGKSTLLKVINKIYKPFKGEVIVKGNVTSFVDLNTGIDPESTGYQNIYIRGMLLGLKKNVIDERIDEIIRFSELGCNIHLPIKTYSSGMLARLAFSIATQFNTRVLLMDEWLSVGDNSFNIKAEKRLLSIVENCDCMVIATHSKKLIYDVCNKVLLLKNGVVTEFGGIEVAKEYFDGSKYI